MVIKISDTSHIEPAKLNLRPSQTSSDSPDPSDDAWTDGLIASSDSCKEACTRARSIAVEVVGLQPLKKAPKSNSVKQYHRLDSMQGVVFYQMLEVTDEYGTQHTFNIKDRTQGALVRPKLLCCSQSRHACHPDSRP